MDAAELGVRAAKRAFTPDISANGSYMRGGYSMNADYGYQLGLQLNYTNLNLMLLKNKLMKQKQHIKIHGRL